MCCKRALFINASVFGVIASVFGVVFNILHVPEFIEFRIIKKETLRKIPKRLLQMVYGLITEL